MATLADFRTAVGAKLGMDGDNAGTDQTLIDGWLNEGVREVLMRTHCFVKCADMSLTADTWKYNLPSSVLAIEYMVDSDSEPLEPVEFSQLLELRRTDSTVASASTRTRYAVLGANLFAIWPTPSAADTLDVFYVPVPSEMSSGTDDPSAETYGGVPVEYHKAVELWALAQGSDHEHEQRTQSGVKYEQAFELYVARVVRAAVNRKGGVRKGRLRVGRRPMIPPGNGVYPRY